MPLKSFRQKVEQCEMGKTNLLKLGKLG